VRSQFGRVVGRGERFSERVRFQGSERGSALDRGLFESVPSSTTPFGPHHVDNSATIAGVRPQRPLLSTPVEIDPFPPGGFDAPGQFSTVADNCSKPSLS
jgi:hypothetical protein